MTNSNLQAWIEAASLFVADPKAVLTCPVCGNRTLRSEDILLPSGEIADRRLYCTTCGAQNFLRLGPEDRARSIPPEGNPPPTSDR
jgi:hypothetical protein